jgi:hypothetical protein
MENDVQILRDLLKSCGDLLKMLKHLLLGIFLGETLDIYFFVEL